MRFRRLQRYAFVMAVALVLTGCGGSSHRVELPIQAATDVSLDEALAELDALETPEGVEEALFAELKDALASLLTTNNQKPTTARFASAPPTGEANRVSDLSITDNGDGTFTLTWHYRNLGDYDQNGTVGIEDITPLAQHFGEDTAPENEWIDGDLDGRVHISDITPIAMHFAAEVHHYAVEGAAEEAGAYELVSEILQDTGSGEERLEYSVIIESPAALWHRVVPCDTEDNPGEPSNAVLRPSNEPIIYEVSPTEGYQHEEYTFSATVTGAESLEYAWDFGGGAEPGTSSESSPTVTLADAGVYAASLTVTNAYGQASFPFTLTVSERDMWAHTWGGEGHEAAEDLAVDEEGNIYVLGYTESFGAGSSDVLVLKYAPDGELQWARTWGGEYPENPVGIAVLSDGNIVVGGDTSNFGAGADDIFILKYDPEGNLLMQKTWGTADYERVVDMAVDEEDNIYFAGYWLAFGGLKDGLVAKFSSDGDCLWASRWDIGPDDRAAGVAVGKDHAVYICTSPEIPGKGEDAALVKYSPQGTLEWVTAWGGDMDERFHGVTAGETVIWACGSTYSFGEGDRDMLFVSFTEEGGISTTLTWGREANQRADSLLIDSSGALQVVGATNHTGYWRSVSLRIRDEPVLSLMTGADYQLLCQMAFDANGNLFQVGGWSSSEVMWQEVDGVVSEPQGQVSSVDATGQVFEGVGQEVQGVVSSPEGIIDIGGGGGDALVLKNFPR